MQQIDETNYLEQRKLLPNPRLMETARRDEARLLTIILRDEAKMQDVLSSAISYKHFLITEHAHFYGYIAKYFDKFNVLPTEKSFRSSLEARMTDDAMISAAVLSFQNRFHTMVDAKEFDPLKEGLINRYVQQQFYESVGGGQRLIDMIGAVSDQRPALATLISSLQNIDTGTEADEYIRVSTAAESIDRLTKSFDERQKNPEIAYGLMTGYPSIDTRFLGLEKRKYMIIVGPPHGCKTTMMLNLAYGMAKQGNVIVFVTMESTDDEIMERLVAAESGIPSLVLKDGKNLRDPDIMSAVNAAKKRIKNVVGDKFILITVPPQTSWGKIQGLIDKQRQFYKVDGFWVDYLDVIKRDVQIQGRPDLELADLSVTIQAYAKRSDMFGGTAQSLNNGAIKELKKRNAFENPEEAAAIAGGEAVGGSQKLWRDADYMLTSLPFKNGKRVTMLVTKARRDGNSDDMFYFGWDPETGRISEYESNYYVIDSVQDACKSIILDAPPVIKKTDEKIEIVDGKEKIVKGNPEVIDVVSETVNTGAGSPPASTADNTNAESNGSTWLDSMGV